MPSESTRYTLKPDSHGKRYTKENELYRRPEPQGEDQSSSSARSSKINTTTCHSVLQGEQNRRTLRNRRPMSYVPPTFLHEHQFEPQKELFSMAKVVSFNSQPERNTNGTLEPSRHKSTRLRISREHPMPAPPALPSLPPQYQQGDRVPVWLLNMAFVKSSEATLRSCQQPCVNSIGYRRVPSPARPTSPSKMILLHKPSQSQTTFFGPHDHTLPPTPGRPRYDAEEYREIYWSQYQYDRNAPHLQPHYVDREPPHNERWANLDMQNPPPISEATPSSFALPPLDVSSADDFRDAEPETKHGNSKKSHLAFGFDLGLEKYKSGRC